jgi:hypothetical protein
VPLINVNAIARSCSAAAIAAAFAAAPLLTSAVSHAEPDPDPPVDLRVECESAAIQGAFSSTTSPDAVTHAVCTYIEDGYFYYDNYDNYDNGVYTGALVNRNGETVPTERPALAPLVPLPRGFPLVPFPGGF